MGTTVKGLTIEIGGSATKLGQELDKVKSTTTLLNTELRTTDKLLKFEASDKVTLFAQKLDKLKQSSSQVAKEIELLNKGVESNKKAFDSGKISQTQYENNLNSLTKQLTTAQGKYDVLQAEISETSTKLNSSKTALDQNADAIDKMGDAASDSGKSVLNLGDLIKANLISATIINGLKSVGTLIGNLASAALNAIKNVGTATKNYVVEALEMAGDYEDNVGLLNQLLKENAAETISWGESNSRAMHLSRLATVQSLDSFTLLFDAMNLGTSKTAAMSKAATVLAADLGAVKGVSTEIAVQDLMSFFAGSTETMRKYGVVILESNVVARALLDTHKESADQLTQEEKQLARYNLLMEQTTNIQGQAEREAGNYKAQVQDLNNVFIDLKTSIGEKLLPVATEIITAVNDFFDSTTGEEVLDALAKGVEDLATEILDFLQSEDFNSFKAEWMPKIEQFVKDLPANLKKISDWTGENLPTMLSDLQKILGVLAGIIDYVNKPGIIGLKNLPGLSGLQNQAAKIANVPQLASGGAVSAGMPYIVGEVGRELFVPKVDGQILNSQQTNNYINNNYSAPVSKGEMQDIIGDIVINLTGMIDNDKLFDAQEKVRRRRGKSLIVGGAI